MDYEMRMPDLSTTGTEVTVIRWLVQVGDKVRRGQPVLELETDKAVMELESVVSGTIKSCPAEPGSAVPTGCVVAVFEVAETATVASRTAYDSVQKPQQPETVPKSSPPSSARRSMFARNRADRRREEPAPETHCRMTPNQRIVGRRMQQSKQTIPHFYLQTSAYAQPMVDRRGAGSPEEISWGAFFVLAAARALRTFERMACRFEDDHLIRKVEDTVGVAVDTTGELYVVPIHKASEKALEQISRELSAAVKRLVAGDPQVRRMQPCNMTITNLGGANVESFVAVVNPPESCVLAVGKVAPVAAVREGAVHVEHRVNLTLSVDHRVANGRYAADFLNAIVRELEAV